MLLMSDVEYQIIEKGLVDQYKTAAPGYEDN